MLRETRDGHLVSRGPLVETSPDVVLSARLRLAACFAVAIGLSLALSKVLP
jgi:hypothetical protein